MLYLLSYSVIYGVVSGRIFKFTEYKEKVYNNPALGVGAYMYCTCSNKQTTTSSDICDLVDTARINKPWLCKDFESQNSNH